MSEEELFNCLKNLSKTNNLRDGIDIRKEEANIIVNEIERLNNIINELEKYIDAEWYCFDNESVEFEVAKDILNKLKELKEE